ncbi:MAG: hypothetical protein QG608_3247 [Actinomycetota bacterium]|nr:hypothetical protein [Actinomycetota bacterium]
MKMVVGGDAGWFGEAWDGSRAVPGWFREQQVPGTAGPGNGWFRERRGPVGVLGLKGGPGRAEVQGVDGRAGRHR